MMRHAYIAWYLKKDAADRIQAYESLGMTDTLDEAIQLCGDHGSWLGHEWHEIVTRLPTGDEFHVHAAQSPWGDHEDGEFIVLEYLFDGERWLPLIARQDREECADATAI